MSIRTRIAPSPTGMPHIGTLFQALLDYVYAKKYQGQFIVRIEDTDRNRYVEGAEDALFSAFDWLGLTPDESTKHGGDYGPYRQSERLDIYKSYAQELIDSDHAYYCFCSPQRLDEVRKAMQKEGKPPMYDQHCRHLDKAEATKRAQTEKHVIRMKVPADQSITFTDEIRGEISFESNLVDDQVILKSDGFPTYHLAVVVDDHLMEITHMVRGEEWISSTPKHVLLYQYLNFDMPKFIHTPLLRNPDRSKLSKRHGHASVSWYQDKGYLPEAVINFLATRVWNHPEGKEIFPIDDLIKHFEFSDMHIQGPIADIDKLNWINGQWIRSLSDDDLAERCKPFYPEGMTSELFVKILPQIKERLEYLSQIPEFTSYFISKPELDSKELLKLSKMDEVGTGSYLSKVTDTLESLDDWNLETLETSLRQLQEQENLKPRPAFMTIRYALTGRTATPPLFDVMVILGQQECIARLKAVSQA